VWGRGYASEATRALAEWAFQHDAGEIFAVVRPGNVRGAATVRRTGMEWVGETEKYFGLTLQVFRLRPADLVTAEPGIPLPPDAPLPPDTPKSADTPALPDNPVPPDSQALTDTA
jgi:hypothetical protein